jgi:hypothetical protein
MATDDMPSSWYDDYERGRPGYPAHVVEVAELARSATTLELAAGTRKLTVTSSRGSRTWWPSSRTLARVASLFRVVQASTRSTAMRNGSRSRRTRWTRYS